MTYDIILKILREIASPGSRHLFSRREAARSAADLIERQSARITELEAMLPADPAEMSALLAASAPNPSDKQEARLWVLFNDSDGRVMAFSNVKPPKSAFGFEYTPLYAESISQSAEQDRIDAELFQRLLHARSELGRTIADPMWPDHGEVTKAALKRWHSTIDEVIKGASK